MNKDQQLLGNSIKVLKETEERQHSQDTKKQKQQQHPLKMLEAT